MAPAKNQSTAGQIAQLITHREAGRSVRVFKRPGFLFGRI